MINPHSKEVSIALYLTRGRYRNQAFAGMMSKPHDRAPAARTMFDEVGIVCHGIYFSSSNGDIICILEGDADQVSQAGAITMASGAFSNITSEELITTEAMAHAMASAGKAMSSNKAQKE